MFQYLRLVIPSILSNFILWYNFVILYRDVNLFNKSNSGLGILEWDRIQKKLAKKMLTNNTYNVIQYFAFAISMLYILQSICCVCYNLHQVLQQFLLAELYFFYFNVLWMTKLQIVTLKITFTFSNKLSVWIRNIHFSDIFWNELHKI